MLRKASQLCYNNTIHNHIIITTTTKKKKKKKKHNTNNNNTNTTNNANNTNFVACSNADVSEAARGFQGGVEESLL